MNVFHLQQGAAIGTLNAQIVRMAPQGAKICVLEVIGNEADEKLAADVATLLSSSRNSQLVETKVQGYQIGTLPEFRNRSYKLYFMG